MYMHILTNYTQRPNPTGKTRSITFIDVRVFSSMHGWDNCGYRYGGVGIMATNALLSRLSVPGSIPQEFIQRSHRPIPFDPIAALLSSRSEHTPSLSKRLELLERNATYPKHVLIIRLISMFHVLTRYVS